MPWGIVLVAGSAVAYSFAGYFTRLIPLDVETLLFWRGIFGGLSVCAVIAVQYRRGSLAVVRASGLAGVVIAVVGDLAAYLYVAAFRRTSVADVSVIYATLPFMTAGVAWLVLREREGWRTAIASLVSLLGAVVMLHGAIGGGHFGGDVLAFAMTFTFAVMMVLMRRSRAPSMLPAVALSCFLMSAITWPVAKVGPLGDLPLLNLALFGCLQLGLGLILLTLGMRRVSATQAALVSLLDVPLAPIWVWLAFDEVPPLDTLAGGAIILTAVIWYVTTARRPGQQDPPARPVEPASRQHLPPRDGPRVRSNSVNLP